MTKVARPKKTHAQASAAPKKAGVARKAATKKDADPAPTAASIRVGDAVHRETLQRM